MAVIFNSETIFKTIKENQSIRAWFMLLYMTKWSHIQKSVPLNSV